MLDIPFIFVIDCSKTMDVADISYIQAALAAWRNHYLCDPLSTEYIYPVVITYARNAITHNEINERTCFQVPALVRNETEDGDIASAIRAVDGLLSHWVSMPLQKKHRRKKSIVFILSNFLFHHEGEPVDCRPCEGRQVARRVLACRIGDKSGKSQVDGIAKYVIQCSDNPRHFAEFAGSIFRSCLDVWPDALDCREGVDPPLGIHPFQAWVSPQL